jgi:hypothetical protein
VSTHKTNYLEAAFLNYVFRSGAAFAPTNLYVALFTAMPDPDDPSGATEVAGNNYARKQVTPGGGNWNISASPNNVISNAADITFNQATPSGWGVVTHLGIADAASGGNFFYAGPITTPKTITANDIFTILAGQLTIQET